jgi:biotin carboxyl carrier protein
MAKVEVRSEMDAKVWKISTAIGVEVGAGDDLLVLESMKMEIPVSAPAAGCVVDILVAPEEMVAEGQLLVVLAS